MDLNLLSDDNFFSEYFTKNNLEFANLFNLDNDENGLYPKNGVIFDDTFGKMELSNVIDNIQLNDVSNSIDSNVVVYPSSDKMFSLQQEADLNKVNMTIQDMFNVFVKPPTILKDFSLADLYRPSFLIDPKEMIQLGKPDVQYESPVLVPLLQPTKQQQQQHFVGKNYLKGLPSPPCGFQIIKPIERMDTCSQNVAKFFKMIKEDYGDKHDNGKRSLSMGFLKKLKRFRKSKSK